MNDMWPLLAGYVTLSSDFYGEMFRRAPVMEDDEDKLARWKVEPDSFLVDQPKEEVQVLSMPVSVEERKAA